MAASDVLLMASGTATLEAMLVGRPMVVAYRFAPLTYWLAKALNLVKVKYFSLPNLLADEPLVPEFLQREVTAVGLADAVLGLLAVARPPARAAATICGIGSGLAPWGQRSGGACRAGHGAVTLTQPRFAIAIYNRDSMGRSIIIPSIDSANTIGGIDEAGRGPLAGAVVAAVVVLAAGQDIEGLRDSKLMSARQRERVAERISREALGWALGRAEAHEIDAINILNATLLAMQTGGFVPGFAPSPAANSG